MRSAKFRSTCVLAVSGGLAAVMPPVAHAEGDWQAAATVYGWFPTMGGTFEVPLGGSASAEMDPSDLLDALNFTFMGAAEVRNGRWGALTDVIYLDLGGTEKNFRDFTLGQQDLPLQVTAKTEVGLSGWVWTLGGTYLVVDDPARPVSLVVGARLLDLTNELELDLNGDITGLPVPGRHVKGEAELSNWDAIVGLKGRFALGSGGGWFVPYYVDVGTGESDFTWQAVLGVGYAFDWGDLTAGWRYMDYDFSADETVEDLWQSGAAIGVTLHF
jgi:hypothetical protein